MRTTLRIGIAMLMALASIAGTGHAGVAAGGRPAGSPLLRTLPIVGATVLAVDERTGHVFVAASPGGPTAVYTLDGRSGAILHKTPLAGQDALILAVDSLTGRVFVATPRPGRVFALDARTGALLRTVRLPGIPAAVAVDEQTGRVFLTEADTGRVDVLDARTGILLRTVRVGARPLALAVCAPTGRVFVANLGSGSVSVLDAHDGTPLHTVRIGGEPLFVAVDPGAGRAFVSGEYGTLNFLDARTGAVVRAVALGAISAQLGVDQRTHRVFQNSLPDSGGAMSVYDAHTGNLLHTTPLDGDPLTTPIVNVRTGHVLVLLASSRAQPGAVVAVDGRTGVVRNSVPVGKAFGADTKTDIQIAVEEHAQRVFVSTINAIVVLDAARL